MPMYLVTSGRDEFGPITMTVRADSLTFDNQFTTFTVGGVIVKAIPNWQVDSVELIDPPASKSE